ncbi:hypothetical protein HJFPF1_05577 [Paramyrothecium foliicola]|nr:hypothetical protein HJFPF1_05577 [Paramyrothecium foliicola]
MALPQSTNIIIISLVFSFLAIIAISLRYQARRVRKARLGADDYLILPGLLLAVGFGVNNTVAVLHGNLGSHIELDAGGIPQFDSTLTVYKKTDLAAQLLSIASLTFTKLSIAFFYRRIFPSKTFRVCTTVLIAAICCWGISFFLADLLQCIPTSEIWESLEGQAGHLQSCYNFIPMFYATAISNMCMDLILLSMPIPMVWKLKNERAPTIYWSQLEAAIAVVCACLPTMGVLFSRASIESAVRSFTSRVAGFSNNSSRSFFAHNNRQPGYEDSERTASAIRLSKPSREEFDLNNLESQRQEAWQVMVSHRTVDQPQGRR